MRIPAPLKKRRSSFGASIFARFKGLSDLSWFGESAEHLLVVLIDIIWRVTALLDPRLHSRRLRILRAREGRLRKQTSKFMILVIYASGDPPIFTKTLIDAASRSTFNLIIISNGLLDSAVADRLFDQCYLLVERANIGRDFGGYKDGISILSERQPSIERLVLANDSVYYLEEDLDKLVAELDGTADLIGVSEVHEHHYHVASFMLSFGPAVLASAAFQRFWRRYLPIGTRRWVIFRGEGALTATLIKAGVRPKILFRAEDVRPHIEHETDPQKLIRLLSVPARDEVQEKLEGATEDGLVDAIVGSVLTRNQMHAGALLFRQFLKIPIIKRDIYYREIYPLQDIRSHLKDLPAPLREGIVADVSRRGSMASAGLFRRLLYRHSAA